MPADQLETFLKNRLLDYLDLLHSWVDVNSFTANRDGVLTLGDLTAEAFSDLGFQVERYPSENAQFGDHLVLTRAGSGEKQVGLISHLDTVFPEEEEKQQLFAWRLEGNRIYGPGTVDIKGGTLLIYMMLDALREFEPDVFAQTTWVVMLDASEETLSDDFGRLMLQQLDGAVACLVFEGGFFEEDTFKLVRQRKGMAKYRIAVEGVASHAGAAHADGVSALVQLAETIRAVSSWTDYEQDITFNIGSASGGTVPNRVPHYAEALGEMRAFHPEVFSRGIQMLRSLEREPIAVGPGGKVCRVEVDVFDITPPWPRNAATDSLLTIWQKAAEEFGWRVLPEARGGLSDGNHTWDIVPTIDGLGPGGGNAHCSVHQPEEGKEQEYLYLPSLIPKTMLNVNAVRQLLS